MAKNYKCGTKNITEASSIDDCIVFFEKCIPNNYTVLSAVVLPYEIVKTDILPGIPKLIKKIREQTNMEDLDDADFVLLLKSDTATNENEHNIRTILWNLCKKVDFKNVLTLTDEEEEKAGIRLLTRRSTRDKQLDIVLSKFFPVIIEKLNTQKELFREFLLKPENEFYKKNLKDVYGNVYQSSLVHSLYCENKQMFCIIAYLLYDNNGVGFYEGIYDDLLTKKVLNPESFNKSKKTLDKKNEDARITTIIGEKIQDKKNALASESTASPPLSTTAEKAAAPPLASESTASPPLSTTAEKAAAPPPAPEAPPSSATTAAVGVPESTALASESTTPTTAAAKASVGVPSENTGNFDVEIWRHAYSCANLKKDKTGYYKITQFQQTWENDPGLTVWGILTALKQSISDRYKPYYEPQLNNDTFVHVSVLFRTWATAICLYLPNLEKDTSSDSSLTLIVSPFLKEEGDDDDNQPLEFSQQITKLHHFYIMLHECSKIANIKLPNHTITIFRSSIDQKTYNVVFDYAEGGSVSLTEPQGVIDITLATPVATPVDNPTENINNSYLWDQHDYVASLVKYDKAPVSIRDNTAPMSDSRQITIDSTNAATYLSSDLNAFLNYMCWCKSHISNINTYFPAEYVKYMKSTAPTKLRIVCHSDTMSTFCKNMNKLEPNVDLKKFLDKKDKTSGASTNMWGIKFTLTHNGEDTLYYFKNRNFIYGAQKPNNTIPASACEDECDFGIFSSTRQLYRGDKSTRVKECKDIMDTGNRNGMGRSSTQKIRFTERGSNKSVSQRIADKFNASPTVSAIGTFFRGTPRTPSYTQAPTSEAIAAAGGKRKTRRIYKQKITRKRKAKKSRKSVRRISRR